MEFLRTEGRMIVDESGREVLLKGYGIGSWLDVEGFLFGSSHFSAEFRPFMRADGMNGGRSIDQILAEVCGRTYADQFWRRYYTDYFAREDIEELARLGINSVRLPLNARVFLKEEPGIQFDEWAFRMLDERIGWCEENGIYVILDMHAAAAGQSAIGCDDGVDNVPHLFTDSEGWERTIRLWEEFALRYRDRGAVAGYELLNEPLALERWDGYLPQLRRFYDETIRRIRAIDPRHMIFLQGHRFASRFDVLEKDMDPGFGNWVLAMHLYETMPDLGVLGPILSVSRDWDVPVWMGETNGSCEYMATLYEMLFENHIGINIWCHKGVEGADAATFLSFRVPEGFEKIRSYGQEGGPRPGYGEAIAVMDAYLEAIRYENCGHHPERVDAFLRRGTFDVPAVGYDALPGRGISWSGKDPYCVFCGYRREDEMHIVYEPGYVPVNAPAFAFAGAGRPPKYGDFPHLELALSEGDFACYTVRDVEGPERVSVEYRRGLPAQLGVRIDGKDRVISVPGDGPEGTLGEIVIGEVTIPGDGTVRIQCLSGSIVLRKVRFARI